MQHQVRGDDSVAIGNSGGVVVLITYRFPLSSVIVSKSGKGRPAAARRSTVDDKSTLMTCIENGEFATAAKMASGERWPSVSVHDPCMAVLNFIDSSSV